MTTHYGNTSTTLNRLKALFGKQSVGITPVPGSDKSDCITCQVRKTNTLPLNHQGKVNDLCTQICGPTLKDKRDGNHVLVDYTRAQLMAQYPHLGLHKRMDKATMIQIIEIHLLQVELGLT
jgi:hypothetical protein